MYISTTEPFRKRGNKDPAPAGHYTLKCPSDVEHNPRKARTQTREGASKHEVGRHSVTFARGGCWWGQS